MPGNLFENGYEHRIGAKLFDYEYNDTIDKEDIVPNIRKCIDGLYTSSLNKQRFACNIRRVGGLMSDFKYNANANVFYGFSKNSYALKFPVKNVFFFNNTFVQRMNRHAPGYQRKSSTSNINSAKHMKFFSLADYYPTPAGKTLNTKTEHYMNSDGTRYTKPSNATPKEPPTVDNFHIKFNINDTANRPDIFTHRLLFFMNGQLFNDLMVYVESDYIIMVIDSDRGGITLDTLRELVDESNDYRWTLIGIPFGNYYTTSGAVYGDTSGVVIPIDGDIGIGWSTKFDRYRINSSGDIKDKEPSKISYKIEQDLVYNDRKSWFGTNAQFNDVNSVYLATCGFADSDKLLFDMSILKPTTTSSKTSTEYPYDIDGYKRVEETTSIFYKAPCLSDRNSYTYLGDFALDKFTNGVNQYMDLIELKNVASVIDLGVNRIFEVGCSGNIPGPVPPENIIIFKRTVDRGLRLVHMVSSQYKESKVPHKNSNYDKEVLRIERPNEEMIPFKSVDKDSVYDYPKFIPIRDKYDVSTEAETQKYIDLYYPNVFKLEGFNSSDNLVAVVFYDKNVNNEFTNPLEKYMKFDNMYANNIVSGNVPKAIIDYIPVINRYTEDLYIHGYHTKATRAVEYQFKLESLRELVNDDSNMLVDIYDRKYKKDKNKMNTNVKYIIDLTQDAPSDVSDYKINHLYRNQIKVTYVYSINLDIRAVIIKTDSGDATRPVDGLTVYYNNNNVPLIHLSDKDANGDPFDASDIRYAQITINGRYAILPLNRTYNTPKRIYTFTMNHKIPATYPATVWVDGVRLQNSSYYISSTAHTSSVSIYSSAINDASYIELEIYKLRDVNSRYKLLTLPDIHDSIAIKSSENEKVWDEISPQNMIVAVARDVIDPSGETVRKYMVPSAYELYWLIIGHTRYNKGVPMNIPVDPSDAAHIYQYNVIKSMQATINTETGQETLDEVVIMSDGDTSKALIGETAETFAGKVDILKTFGDQEYFKVLENIDMNLRYTCSCGHLVGINHGGETCPMCNTEVAKRPLESFYTVMLREGYYNRDRKRFFEYLPMSKKDPMVYITPITEYFSNKDVMVKNTDVYFSNTYSFEMLNGMVIKNSIQIDKFDLDPAPTKYRFYMDGLLLDYDYDFVASVDTNRQEETYYMGDPIVLFVKKPFDKYAHHVLTFEYLPYRYQLVQRSAETDGVLIFEDEFIRPYDPRNFDIYMDGKLLREDEIDVITERRIVIKPIANNITELDHTPIVSIYEKMHDNDVFTHVWRKHQEAFEYVDHDTPVIEVDDMTFYGKVTKVVVKGENDDPDDMSGTLHTFSGIYVYTDEDENMVLDLTTRDNSSSALDPDVDADEKYVVVNYYALPDTDPQEYDKTVLIVPYNRTVTTPRKTGKPNIKRQPLDPNKTIDVRFAEPIKHSLDEQIIRSNSEYRQSRTPTYSSTPTVK